MKAWLWRVLIAWLVHGMLGVIDPARTHSHFLIAMSVFVVMTVFGGAVGQDKEQSR